MGGAYIKIQREIPAGCWTDVNGGGGPGRGRTKKVEPEV